MEGGGAGFPAVPGYEISRLIGRGGFAAVYEAQQVSVGRAVALKVMSVSAFGEDTERRFRAECRSIGGLSWHPHVVALHDAGTTGDGLPFLSMELLPGGSLGDRMRQGALAPEEVVEVGIQVADALGAAHDAGVLHRDVKPENLLIGRRGEVQLTDFGIATLSDGTRTATGTFTGTIAYTPPELLKGERATARSDLYSLGATLHALLTGRAAFSTGQGDPPAAIMWRVVSEPPAPLPDSVPAALRAVLERAMSKEPNDRFASAAEMQAALSSAQTELSGGGAVPPAYPPDAPTVVPVPVPPVAPAAPVVTPAPVAAPPPAPAPVPVPPAPADDPALDAPTVARPATAGAPPAWAAAPAASSAPPGAATSFEPVAGPPSGPPPATADGTDPGGAAAPRRWGRWAAVAAVVLVVALVAAVLATRSGGSDDTQVASSGKASSKAADDEGQGSEGQPAEEPAEPKLAFVGDTDAGDALSGTSWVSDVVGADGSVWVLASRDLGGDQGESQGVLVRYDEASGRFSAPVDLPGSAGSIALADGVLWITGGVSTDEGYWYSRLWRVDPTTLGVVATLEDVPFGSVYSDGDALFAAETGGYGDDGTVYPGTVYALEPSTGVVRDQVEVGGAIDAVTVSGGALYVSLATDADEEYYPLKTRIDRIGGDLQVSTVVPDAGPGYAWPLRANSKVLWASAYRTDTESQELRTFRFDASVLDSTDDSYTDFLLEERSVWTWDGSVVKQLDATGTRELGSVTTGSSWSGGRFVRAGDSLYLVHWTYGDGETVSLAGAGIARLDRTTG